MSEEINLDAVVFIFYTLGVLSYPAIKHMIVLPIITVLTTPGEIPTKDRLQLEIRRVIEKISGRKFR